VVKRENRIRRLRGQKLLVFDWKVYALPTKKNTVTASQMLWPLHAKPVSLIDDALFAEIGDDIFRFLWDDNAYWELLSSPPCKFPSSTISDADVHLLIERNLISEIALDEIPTGCVGIVFCVAENSKMRRRLVHDTLTPNVEISTDPSVSFTPVSELMSRVNQFNYVATFDFSSFYYQFGLGPRVRKYFSFRVGNKYYCMNRLPMGFKMACAIAQKVSTFLSTSPYDVKVEVYIDNVMILGKCKEVVEQARLYFLARCEKYGVQLSEDSGTQTSAVFRGMLFDFVARTVCLKPAYVDYFEKCNLNTLTTWADWRSHIGKVVYAAQVLQIPMCRIYLLLKLLSQNVLTNPTAKVDPTHSVMSNCKSMNEIIAKNTPRRVYEESVDTKIVVTDAALSTGKWGAILISNAKVYYASGDLSLLSYENCSINVAELEAVKKACEVFGLRERTLRVLTDNASTLFWLRATWSPVFQANSLLQSIFARVNRVFVLYVPSGLNPADPLSRDAPLSPLHAEFVLFLRRTAVAARWGGGGDVLTNTP
jgi:hypothetical protein